MLRLYEPMDPVGHAGARLLRGCFVEAERSGVVSYQLDGLRHALHETSDSHLAAVIEEISAGSGLLRELSDLSQIHQDRIPLILDPLVVVLPCLSRSLRDITAFLHDRTRTKVERWRGMWHSMAREAHGLSLPDRFMIYNRFLCSIRDLLTRSPSLDLSQLDRLRRQILMLREGRGIPPPPVQVGPVIRTDPVRLEASPATHWAEHIFSSPLSSHTALGHQRPSKSLGPHHPWGHLEIPLYSKILFRRSFNDDHVSLMVFLNGVNKSPYLLLRIFDQGVPWFSVRGVHELCFERDGSCLHLKRWSSAEACSKTWAVLCFLTWEELVLTHSTFIALKARNKLTVRLDPDGCSLRGEDKLFQASIVDDNKQHSLIVYKDRQTHGIRLHAAVWSGDIRRCPVWTAFVTHQSASRTWLSRVSRHRVHLADVHLYVFCHEYRQVHQRRGPVGAFEIRFLSDEAASRFEELFSQRSATPATEG